MSLQWTELFSQSKTQQNYDAVISQFQLSIALDKYLHYFVSQTPDIMSIHAIHT